MLKQNFHILVILKKKTSAFLLVMNRLKRQFSLPRPMKCGRCNSLSKDSFFGPCCLKISGCSFLRTQPNFHTICISFRLLDEKPSFKHLNWWLSLSHHLYFIEAYSTSFLPSAIPRQNMFSPTIAMVKPFEQKTMLFAWFLCVNYNEPNSSGVKKKELFNLQLVYANQGQ